MLDLEGAREMIDMLDVLREKTVGNLAPEEDTLLLDVLGNLKLAFMEMTKAATAAPTHSITSVVVFIFSRCCRRLYRRWNRRHRRHTR